jgi:hypothetical protein
MFLIFGIVKKARKLTTGKLFCPTCKNSVVASNIEVKEFFTLFFIPLFTLSTTYLAGCTGCGQTYQLDEPPKNAETSKRKKIALNDTSKKP